MPTYYLIWGSIHFNFPLIIFLRLYHFWTSWIGGISEQQGQYETIACQNVHLYLKKRGTYHLKLIGKRIVVVKWHDNNVANVASNSLPVEPLHQVSRYVFHEGRKKKKKIVDQPHCIYTYNRSMGGVDRCHQNISLYRTSLRGKKWYLPLIEYCLDLAVQNAWQLYRLHGGKLDHLTFRRQIVLALLQTNKSSRERGRQSSLENIESRFNNASLYSSPREASQMQSMAQESAQKNVPSVMLPFTWIAL
jgi:hypothetical protein